MIGCSVFALAVRPRHSRSTLRLEARTRCLSTSLIVLKRAACRIRSRTMIAGSLPAEPLVSPSSCGSTIILPERLVRCIVCRFSLLLALEVAPTVRANRRSKRARALIRRMSVENPRLIGARRGIPANCQLGLRSPNQALSKYWSTRGATHRDGDFPAQPRPDIAAHGCCLSNYRCDSRPARAFSPSGSGRETSSWTQRHSKSDGRMVARQ